MQVSATALEVHHAVRKNGRSYEVTVTNWRPGVECLVAIDGLPGACHFIVNHWTEGRWLASLAGTAPGCGAAIAPRLLVAVRRSAEPREMQRAGPQSSNSSRSCRMSSERFSSTPLSSSKCIADSSADRSVVSWLSQAISSAVWSLPFSSSWEIRCPMV